MNTQNTAQQLVDFINASPTSFFAVQSIVKVLNQAGFECLDERQEWKLELGKAYYTQREDASLIAFVCGQKLAHQTGFMLAGAHTDSPCLAIRPNTAKKQHGLVSYGVDLYGGPIVATWVDRELALAARVLIADDNDRLDTRYVNITRPVAIVPNIAVHLNREINNGFAYNVHKHMRAIFEATESDDPIMDLLCQELQLEPAKVVSYDAYLYDATPAQLVGANKQFICGARQDNLSMCHAILSALVQTPKPYSTIVGMFYDNEETGSQTRRGADSGFLRDVLARIVEQDNQPQAFARAIAGSFMVSADMAHAAHPNYPELQDLDYVPVLNGGPVIKFNANQRYATTAETAAMFMQLCHDADVKCQRFSNRADMRCGSTIGPMTSAATGIKTVDVGNPIFAMHSIRETGGTADHEAMIKALRKLYV